MSWKPPANLATRAGQVAAALLVLGGVLLAYRGLLETGFIYDDWHWLRYAIDHRPLPYLLKIINPLEPQYFYRPISRLLFYAEYLAFGRDASGWHLVSILLQAANGVLWAVLLHLLTRRALLGVLAALTFAVYPAMSEAVFWISDVEMLLGVFFGLLCLLLWSRFLLTASRPALAACLGCLVLSLLSKETMLVLAPLMVFVHLGLRSVRRLAQPVGLLPYAAVAVVLGLYLAADLYVLSHHVPVMGTSYVPGWHALADLYYYLQVLLTPFRTWTARSAPDLLLRLVVGMAVFVALWRRSGWIAAFLMAVAIIGLLPYLSWHGYAMRYTYVAALGVTGLAALAVCELLLWRGRLWPVVSALTMAAYALLLGGMLTDVQERRLEWEQLTNEQAKVLRDVQALDPALPSGSALYFLNSPTRSDYTVQMMYDMIDRGLRASTTDLGELPVAADGAPTNIYYYRDGTLKRASFSNGSPVTPASRALPVRFGSSIDLIGYDVPNPTISPGQPFIFLPYWRASGPVGRNYSVFVHLVGKNGERVAQLDSYPQEGRSPTSNWRPGQFIGDYYILPIPESLPPGELWIEMGLYDLDTMQRLEILDEAGNPVEQSVRIGPLASGAR